MRKLMITLLLVLGAATATLAGDEKEGFTKGSHGFTDSGNEVGFGGTEVGISLKGGSDVGG